MLILTKMKYSRNSQNRKSWNDSLFKGLDHPAAFPSMLRSSGPTAAQSHADLRSAKVNRRDSFGSMSLRNNDFDSTKRYSIGGTSGGVAGGGGNNGLRRESFGGSMYLRRDSSGNTNLIKRDSFGSQGLKGNGLNSLSQKDLTILRNYSTMPRDYVKVVVDNNKSNLKKEINSILRKDSFKSVNNNKHVYIEDKVENILNNKENYKENEKKKNVVLTKENLTKHVTLLENENNFNNNKTDYVKKELNTEVDGKESLGRRDSSDSYGSSPGGYGTNRRISIDSLDVRRNSWGRRSSQGSSILGNGIKEFNEVFNLTISWFESLII